MKERCSHSNEPLFCDSHLHRTLAVLAIQIHLHTGYRVHKDDGLNLLFTRPVNVMESLKNPLIRHFKLHLRHAIAKASMNTMAKG